ncbi:peptidoglycan-binding protein [Streptomyces dangxiongensis]|uniref:Peptidoglycan-binding protein n=1 Tax=Streptomyces dangxiongensis TaxID=1442032 RepID=A0A3G2JLE5_9ACTN|nr:peptidoglycan-binding protein [Streptomyces dangxiongensis]AYN41142.1 peptidoglycan-binding protein [Streptomyces dangxiongensis]
MTAPVFEDVDPASDCDCPGCVLRRRTDSRPRPARLGGHPAARGVVVVAAASAALGAVPPAAALTPGHPPHRQALPGDGEPGTPQGTRSPLHGPAARPPSGSTAAPVPATTRTEIVNRARTWVAARVPYGMDAYWPDGYRQDCSGYVSMAWGLPGNEWTGSLGRFGVRITREELRPGDILLHHNPDDPQRTAGATPAGTTTPAAYPGAASFGPGADNAYVTLLGRMLTARGAGAYYADGPGPVWGDADRQATQAFQRAQGWTGADADGLPGPAAWELLATGEGEDVGAGTPGPARRRAPGYPGGRWFRPGAANDHVTRLGVQLVRKGFGRFYPLGPGPHWGDADRRAVAAFQRAQGRRGGPADGYPGPDTWRRLFA